MKDKELRNLLGITRDCYTDYHGDKSYYLKKDRAIGYGALELKLELLLNHLGLAMEHVDETYTIIKKKQSDG